MKTTAELEGRGLKWMRTGGLRNNGELRDEDGEVLATISQPSIWRRMVEVEAVGNRWRFERKGIFRQRIEISSIGTGEAPAIYIYQYPGNKGRLEYADGRVFLWRQGNFWGSKWVWTTEDGVPLIGFKTGGFWRLSGEMSLHPNFEEDKAPSLLVFLGWYLIMLYYEDSAGSSTVVTV
ncbi:MAG: hypothetical protein SNJ59_15660 [Aggregatilineales bacterium]